MGENITRMKLRKITQNKKGQFELITMAIVLLVLVIAGGIIWFTFYSIDVELDADPDFAPYTGPLDDALSSFKILNWGVALIYVVMIISFFISSYFIDSNPIWFFIHLFVVIISVIITATIANVFYDLTLEADIGVFILANLSIPTKFLFALPVTTVIVGFISMVLLGAKDNSQGYVR